jgi:hypothetical protein
MNNADFEGRLKVRRSPNLISLAAVFFNVFKNRTIYELKSY